MGVAWQAGPARAVVFLSSDPPYDPSVASKVARHHLHPTSTESCMAKIMEPPTSQPAHQNEHKAVRSSGKNTRPVAEGPRPPKPHSPDRPRRRRRRFSSSLQGRPAYHTYPTPLHSRPHSAYPAPTLYLPTPTLPGKLVFTEDNHTFCLQLASALLYPPKAATFHQYRPSRHSQPTLHLPYTTTLYHYRVSHTQPTLHRYPAPTLHRRQNRRASLPAPRDPDAPPPAPSLPRNTADPAPVNNYSGFTYPAPHAAPPPLQAPRGARRPVPATRRSMATFRFVLYGK